MRKNRFSAASFFHLNIHMIMLRFSCRAPKPLAHILKKISFSRFVQYGELSLRSLVRNNSEFSDFVPYVSVISY